MNIEELRRELGNPPRPKHFWQRPFDDHDPDRYEKLCRWCESEAPLPPRESPYLLDNYVEELLYLEELQPDLSLFLLPLLLRTWSMNLRGQTVFYAGYAEWFWMVWNATPRVREKGLLDLLSEQQRKAVERYTSDAILESIHRGRKLRHQGSGAYCYLWLREMGSFATVLPSLASLWSEWWNLSTEGRAIGALQYLSCLMYENDANPVFPPWTPDGGGGPPWLWTDSMAANDRPWNAANIAFLKGALVPDRLFEAIDLCAQRLSSAEDRELAGRMKSDFATQRTLLEFRIEQLPAILATEGHGNAKWII